jgi:hypothetical protein
VKVLEKLLPLVGRSRHASAIVLASLLAALVGFAPASAAAITRAEVLTRAHSWVTKRIIYSQRARYAGYRRDCSGFVSMAWRLRTSYTSSSIHAVARRIPLWKLRPGDAVHTPGHVAIFVKWKSRARHTYVAMEESRWGRPAMRHVRSLGRGATALRYRRIAAPPVLVAALALSAETTPIVAIATVAGF